jgi:hypothetical protein
MILEITFVFILIFIGYRGYITSLPVVKVNLNQEGGDPYRFIRFWTIIDWVRNTWIFR